MSKTEKSRMTRAGIGLIALAWLVYCAATTASFLTHPEEGADFRAYYQAAVALNQGEPLYTAVYGDKTYLYPPLLALLLAPVTAVADYRGSQWVWIGANLLLLAATTALLTRALAGSRQRRMVLWLLPILYMPTFMTLWMGQANILMFACIAGAWLAWRTQRPALAGALLAVGVWIKIYTIVSIAYLIWKRDWRAVRGAFGAGVLLGALQLLLVGWLNLRDYALYILPPLVQTGQTTIYHSNVSLVGFAAKLFLPTAYVQAPLVESVLLFNLTRAMLIVGMILATIYAVSHPVRLTETAPARRDLEYALVVTASLLVTTSMAASGMVSLLLVFAILLCFPAGPLTRRRIRLWCLLAYVLSALESFLFFGYLDSPEKTVPALVLLTPTISMVILWGLLFALLIHLSGRNPVRDAHG